MTSTLDKKHHTEMQNMSIDPAQPQYIEPIPTDDQRPTFNLHSSNSSTHQQHHKPQLY